MDRCKEFFKAVCKAKEVTQKDGIKGVFYSSSQYWGNDGNTADGHCIWCARSEYLLDGRSVC